MIKAIFFDRGHTFTGLEGEEIFTHLLSAKDGLRVGNGLEKGKIAFSNFLTKPAKIYSFLKGIKLKPASY